LALVFGIVVHIDHLSVKFPCTQKITARPIKVKLNQCYSSKNNKDKKTVVGNHTVTKKQPQSEQMLIGQKKCSFSVDSERVKLVKPAQAKRSKNMHWLI